MRTLSLREDLANTHGEDKTVELLREIQDVVDSLETLKRQEEGVNSDLREGFSHAPSTESSEEPEEIKSGFVPIDEFSIDRQKLRRMLDEAHKDTLTNYEKGLLCEDLAAYLVESCGSLFIVEDRRKDPKPYETDLLLATKPNSWVSIWGRLVPVECKNEHGNSPIGSVAKFYRLMELSSCTTGVFLSLSGFTQPALDEIRMIFRTQPTSRLILPIDGNDIQAVIDGANFIRSLWEKEKWVRFG